LVSRESVGEVQTKGGVGVGQKHKKKKEGNTKVAEEKTDKTCGPPKNRVEKNKMKGGPQVLEWGERQYEKESQALAAERNTLSELQIRREMKGGEGTGGQVSEGQRNGPRERAVPKGGAQRKN